MTERGPLARYRALLENDQLQPDAAQQIAIERLEQRYATLVDKRTGVIDRWRRRHPPVEGLYVHGRVGRGKTMLMDLFAESLHQAGVATWRIHFHRFMDHVQDTLKRHGRQRDPLPAMARTIAGRCRVLCFDEFHVSDIADAMLLAGLLQPLFGRGLCLVATSNTEPRDLYAGGLQRKRFMPAIEAIERHCEVLELDAETDYRLRELSRHRIYYHPISDDTREEMESEFASLTRGEPSSNRTLEIRGRTLEPLRRAGPVAWFDFETLCLGPRSSGDYIELARRFSTLFLSDIPAMDEADNDAARRFIHLVDECYDRAVKLVVSAEVAPEALYRGKRLAAPFERTVSRLIEMQSHEYLGREHRP
ncbi:MULTISPECIES: cell division protein ZapE [unclassified Wenzhouxiangella]|uniref:cell division protein ZapE n=1 Tax=unclassified Wenzhouxiangella TaxID=2613841 RepID=UPI000E325FB2|nr:MULTISPECIES: cell division protein ZapE [unclassified Wenzhouxiangella]RFF28373.1 AFG1 family ATPase [Wenzhouxiangella sp. 15181]RFP69889.1 AFG1 family ATPase [Wenzhouxiangella sp. 15190]